MVVAWVWRERTVVKFGDLEADLGEGVDELDLLGGGGVAVLAEHQRSAG